MKKLMLNALATAFSLLSATAMAQDLRADRSGFYVGGFTGTTVDSGQKLDFGIRTGYQFGSHFRTELEYQNSYQNRASNSFNGTGILQYRIPSTALTPYVHAGFGVSVQDSRSVGTYSAGGGIRLAVATNFELDGRYTYRGAFDSNTYYPQAGTSAFTLGANFRF